MALSGLNLEQYKAATTSAGANLIVASAGTGKTSTIVARIAYLLKEQSVRPEHILLLTFTNKAASEMLSRVQRYFDKSIVQKIESGTFHAVSYRLLKRMGKDIKLKTPKDLKILLKSIYAKRRFDHIDSPIKPYQSSYLYDLFSLYQNSTIELDFSQWLDQEDSEHGVYFDIYEDIFEEFENLKREYGYVGFNDLLIKMKEALKTDRDIRFSEVLVDEYQDTNTLQNSLIDAFDKKSLFCVGDYDQSIYAFNGADIEIIGTFKDRYKNAKIFKLNKNYRSTAKILSLANRVIKNNPRLYDKELEVTRSGNSQEPRLLVYDELFSQYHGISGLIKASITPKEEIAVIFRNNASADGIEATLRELGVSCKRKGGVSFFDSKEVKAMIDLVSIVLNPKDMMSFIHIFEYAKGIGSALSKELFEGLFKLGNGDIYSGFFHPKDIANPFKSRAKNYQLGLFDDFGEFGSVGRFYKLGFEENFLSNPILKHSKLSEDGAKFIYAFYRFLKNSKRIKSPNTLISHISSSEIFLYITNILATNRAAKKDGSIDEKLKEEAKERIRRKGYLLGDIASNYSSIERFLNAITLGSGEMSEGEGVNLLSIHASKGLEFTEVYVIDLMDGRFPNRKLMSKGGSLEEERRLFYVAATRAKDRLFLSYAKYDKIKKITYIHSPFLVEAGLMS